MQAGWIGLVLGFLIGTVSLTALMKAGATGKATLSTDAVEAYWIVLVLFAPFVILFGAAVFVAAHAALTVWPRWTAGTFSHGLTPIQANHEYVIKAWNSAAATGIIGAGAGGTGATLLPGLIRVTRVPM